MKKLIIALLFILGLTMTQSSHAQASEDNEKSEFAQKFNGYLFDGISGIMVYSLYNNNNFVMDMFQKRLISKDSAFDHAIYLERASKYVIELIDIKVAENDTKNDLKKSDLNYLKELKSTLIIIGGQSTNLKDYINGNDMGRRKFDLNRNTAMRKVNKILGKE